MKGGEARVLAALEGARLKGAWWRCNCPFCEERVGKEDRDHTLSVNADSGGYRCFRCSAKGRIRLPEERHIEKRQAPTEKLFVGIPETFTLLASSQGLSATALEPARAYLRSRGLAESVWQEASIGACYGGLYAGRIVIPVLDEDGERWRGFSSRVWTKNCDKKLKYRNATGEWRRTTIYNPNALAVETDEPCYVVEGCFDALALWPHAVAVLGDATEEHVQMLATARRPVVVVLDGDAWIKGWSLAMRLRLEGATAGAVQLPSGKDPDEVDPAWLWEEARASLA